MPHFQEWLKCFISNSCLQAQSWNQGVDSLAKIKTRQQGETANLARSK